MVSKPNAVANSAIWRRDLKCILPQISTKRAQSWVASNARPEHPMENQLVFRTGPHVPLIHASMSYNAQTSVTVGKRAIANSALM
jgi:hypothetical protein